MIIFCFAPIFSLGKPNATDLSNTSSRISRLRQPLDDRN
jgi:hypothetical protein